jgi:hypothetical protein
MARMGDRFNARIPQVEPRKSPWIIRKLASFFLLGSR